MNAILKAKKDKGGDATELRQVIEANTATNAELMNKLTTLDSRLAAVEKTLTDIP